MGTGMIELRGLGLDKFQICSENKFKYTDGNACFHCILVYSLVYRYQKVEQLENW